jgi:tRNA(adenine34) deaminase
MAEQGETDLDKIWMLAALAEARQALEIGEVPVGAIVVRAGEIVGRGHNLREREQNPLAHAELVALRQAAASLASWRLLECTLVVTLEPCAMCAGALVNSRIARLVYGASDPKAGFCGTLGDLSSDRRLNHRFAVRSGVMAAECSELLRGFFATLRQ